MMFVTEAGLVERNEWQRIRAFAEGAATLEPNWRENYWSWRDRVDALIAGR
jgi:hypothetical protein